MSQKREDSGSVIVSTATDALIGLSDEIDPKDPFAASLVRALTNMGAGIDEDFLLEHWRTRSVGSPSGDMRYRWELTHRHTVEMPSYAPSKWGAWRSVEKPLLERDRFAFEERLTAPIVMADTAELLAKRAVADGPDSLAATLLDEASPTLRRDFARHVQAIHPWADTFALWCLTRRPLALSSLHPLAVAIATCHAADVEPGMEAVFGKRFPFHRQPLVSASAQLAAGLLALGLDLEMVGHLAAYVAKKRHESGGWGDVTDECDVLTTLVSADLLSHIDPSFDLEETCAFLLKRQGPDGLFRALGPEAPWLTFEIVRLIESGRRPFARRFRWPFMLDANRDHKTSLPFYAYFVDVARLFQTLPGLARTSTEMAFIDLIGFRAFNNTYGQGRGDDVLRAFATALAELAGSAVIRDGGDEFLVVGAPCRRGLEHDIEVFRQAWPARFASIFGEDVPTVAPRILLAESPCGAIVQTREQLGREIGLLKDRVGPVGPQGVLATI